MQKSNNNRTCSFNSQSAAPCSLSPFSFPMSTRKKSLFFNFADALNEGKLMTLVTSALFYSKPGIIIFGNFVINYSHTARFIEWLRRHILLQVFL